MKIFIRIFATFALMASAAAMAQPRIISRPNSDSGLLQAEHHQVLTTQANASTNPCSLTIKDNAEGGSLDDRCEIMILRLGGEMAYGAKWDAKLKRAVAKVDPGVYDIVVPMRVNGMKAWVIRENVDIQSDLTLKVSASEASELFTFHPVDESGTRLEGPVYDYYETFEVTDGPDRAATAYKFLIHEDFGEFYVLMSQLGILDFGPQDGKYFTMDEEVFYMSPNSHFSVHAIYFFSTDHGQYAISLGSKGYETQTLTNNPADFVTVDNTITLSPGAEMEKDVTYEGFVTIYGDEVSTTNLSSIRTPGILANKFFVYSNPDNDCKADIMVIPIECEYMVEEMYSRASFNLVGSPVRIIDGVATHIATGGYNGHLSNQFTCNPDGEYSDLTDCNPNWGYEHPEGGITFGNNCPTLLAIPYINKKKSGLDFTYIGRFDETRNLDIALADIVIEKDGAKVYEGDLAGSQEYWLKAKSGSHTMTVTNENVLVDGIEGKNVSVMTFDPSADDPTPPGIGALRFVDKKGEITDRFANSGDGVLMIAVGDNSYGECERTYIATGAVKSLKVEYAPYLTESYSEIPLNPLDDLFSHRYGQTYTGDLAYVEHESANGWYDIRVSLEDEAGNECVQTISPAFKIDKINGVKNAAASESGIIFDGVSVCGEGLIELFDAAGMLIASSPDGLISTSRLSSGIYIVRNGCFRSKISVK